MPRESQQGLDDLGVAQKHSVSQICMQCHFTARDMAERYHQEAGRYFYTTPTMYLQLLDSYISLKRSKQAEVQAKQRRYEVGLEKLLSTASQVSDPAWVGGRQVPSARRQRHRHNSRAVPWNRFLKCKES